MQREEKCSRDADFESSRGSQAQICEPTPTSAAQTSVFVHCFFILGLDLLGRVHTLAGAAMITASSRTCVVCLVALNVLQIIFSSTNVAVMSETSSSCHIEY